MIGEMKIKLEDGREFSGRIAVITVTENQSYDEFHHGGVVQYFPTFKRTRMEIELLGEVTVSCKSKDKPKTVAALSPTEFKRAISFED